MKDFVTIAIKAALEKEVRVIIEKESEEAAKRVRAEIGRRVDSIALEVFSQYSMVQDRDMLTIQVRKYQ
jgi:uncharacterized protein (UPF0212 family)